MLQYTQLILEQNNAHDSRYQSLIGVMDDIWNETVQATSPLLRFGFAMADKLVKAIQLESLFTPTCYLNADIEELKAANAALYEELSPKKYATSMANPAYTTEIFGDECGPLFAAIYSGFRSLHKASRSHRRYTLVRWMELLKTLYPLLKAGSTDASSYKEPFVSLTTELTLEEITIETLEHYEPNANGLVDFVMKADLHDLRYLYQYGIYISANELELASYANALPQNQIDELAEMMVKAYERGFSLARKDMGKKNTVNIYSMCGLERFVQAMIPRFRAKALDVIISMPSTTSINRQYGYDHRFDQALWLDADFVKTRISQMNASYETCKQLLDGYSGIFYFDRFGETPFKPEQKKSCFKLDEDQQQLRKDFNLQMSSLRKNFMPRTETSFAIIGFPVPEIGDNFAEIFRETVAINAIDTEHHEQIQQHLVDVLDTADVVQVKGKNGNRTNIVVKMQTLQDPATQSNFVNCGADVNIPVGEVFTSPQLTGTNGILHLKKSFLEDLEYLDLELTFSDGYVTDYSCKNFGDDAEKNRQYIQENLLFPHKTLPLGEFAIGTNTQAYRMAQKYDILPILPVLIVEKMGPHFAIGDTCFSWEEDFSVYNPIDGKEITARDNEHSIKRKTSLKDAYTNCHTDITLPYEDLDFITAIEADGTRHDIIRNGRFVVEGTRELNIPLDALDGERDSA